MSKKKMVEQARKRTSSKTFLKQKRRRAAKKRQTIDKSRAEKKTQKKQIPVIRKKVKIITKNPNMSRRERQAEMKKRVDARNRQARTTEMFAPEPGFLEGVWMWLGGGSENRSMYYGESLGALAYSIESPNYTPLIEGESETRPQYMKTFTTRQLQKMCLLSGKRSESLPKTRDGLEICAYQSIRKMAVSKNCKPGFFQNLWYTVTFASDERKKLNAIRCDKASAFDDSVSMNRFIKLNNLL